MKTNNHFNLKSAAMPGLIAALILILSSAGGARAQVVTTTPTATTVYPTPQQIELGPVLDVVAYVLADGYTVNLTLIPSLTEFVGYETPPPFPVPAGAVLVPTILPAFRVRQVATTINVWDSQTVVLGGLISENVTKTLDKVPILGDLPLLGKMFRSESKTSEKKNLMIFVTPTIIDQAGNRVHTDDEMPFAQTPGMTPPQPQSLRPAEPSAPARRR